MFGGFRSFVAPLVGLTIFSAANGYLMSLVPLRLNLEGSGSFEIGLAAALYHFGLLLGAFRTERLISAIGHIRAFAAFMALLGTIVGIQGLVSDLVLWQVLRLLSGIAVAGIFLVVESWLLSGSEPSNRGTLLALYMISYYGASAAGQMFLGPFGVQGYEPFLVILALLAASSMPPSLTRLPAPPIHPPSALNILKLYKLTPSGLLGCMASGLAIGSLYGLLPLHFAEQGIDEKTTGNLVAITIVGGMLLQYPVGRLSDRMDRRKVLIAISFLGVAVSIFLILSLFNALMWVWLFLLGGVIFTLYPLAISHGCDHMPPEDMVAATQGMLLAYSLGATIGPLGSSVMMKVAPNGLFVSLAAIMLALAVFFIFRLQQRPPIITGPEEVFVPMPGHTPVVSEINPRTDQDALVDK